MSSEAITLSAAGFVFVTLVAILGFFLRALVNRLDLISERFEQAVAKLGLHDQRMDGLERLVGKLEGKAEAAERRCSEQAAQAIVNEKRMTIAEAEMGALRSRLQDFATARRAAK